MALAFEGRFAFKVGNPVFVNADTRTYLFKTVLHIHILENIRRYVCIICFIDKRMQVHHQKIQNSQDSSQGSYSNFLNMSCTKIAAKCLNISGANQWPRKSC